MANVVTSYIFRAMASSGAKEQFLRQMEQIVEGIKQNRIKVNTLIKQVDIKMSIHCLVKAVLDLVNIIMSLMFNMILTDYV